MDDRWHDHRIIDLWFIVLILQCCFDQVIKQYRKTMLVYPTTVIRSGDSNCMRKAKRYKVLFNIKSFYI